MSEKNHPNQAHLNWYRKYYGQLAGATIEKVIIGIDDEFGDVWPGFQVKLEDGREFEIQVQADEEGNGPGFINGLPRPGVTEPAKHPHAGDSSYFAKSGALLFAEHGATVGKVSDDREEAALIKINNDRETVRIGEDTGNPGTYMVDVIVGDNPDSEPTLLIPHLSQGDVIEKVGHLVEGNTVKRDAEMLNYAEMLLADQHARLWHSGGGIWLIVGFYGDYKITACSDDTELSTYGLEVTHETEDGTESVLHKDGLTPSQLVNLWSDERRKLAEGDNKPAYMASIAATLLEDHGTDVTTTADGRRVATVKIVDTDVIEIGQDPDSPDRYAIFLTDWTVEDPEPAFKLGDLDEKTMVEKAVALIAGREGVRHDLMFEHALQLLEPFGGRMWHSGGGIWLIATFGSGKRVSVAPDEAGPATFGLEVIDQDGEVLDNRTGLNSSELVATWKEALNTHLN